MVRWIGVVLLVLVLASPASAADGVGALRTYCMDAWAGEVCFDITTFQITGTQLTIGGNWYGPGYPAGYRDHHGRGVDVGVRLFDQLETFRFFDPDTQAGTIVTSTEIWTYDTILGYDEWGDAIYEDHYLYVDGWDDIAGFSFNARVRTEPDEYQSLWEEADCFTPGWTHLTNWRGESQPCRVVSVPEPGALLLVTGGIFGLAYVRKRHA